MQANNRSQSLSNLFDHNGSPKEIRRRDFLIPIRLEKKSLLHSPNKNNIPLKDLLSSSLPFDPSQQLQLPAPKRSLPVNSLDMKSNSNSNGGYFSLKPRQIPKEQLSNNSQQMKNSQLQRKASSDIEFKPFQSERDGVGKLLQSVSQYTNYNLTQDVGPTLKTQKLPTIFQTQRMLESMKTHLNTQAKVDMTKTIESHLKGLRSPSNELSINSADDHYLTIGSNNETINSNKGLPGLLGNPLFCKKSRNENFNPLLASQQQSQNPSSDSITFSYFKLNEKHIDSYVKLQSKLGFQSDKPLQSEALQQNRQVMMESYKKLQKKLYDSTYRKQDKDAPKLNNYNADEFAKNIYHQQPTVGSYTPMDQMSPQNHLPSLKHQKTFFPKDSMQVQNEKIKRIMSDKYLKLERKQMGKTIAFGMRNDLKHMTTEQLLQMTYQQSSRKTDKNDKKQKGENENAKNMVKERKFEFHQREQNLGLSQVPLERPLNGRNQIKGIIIDIRTNINKISF